MKASENESIVVSCRKDLQGIEPILWSVESKVEKTRHPKLGWKTSCKTQPILRGGDKGQGAGDEGKKRGGERNTKST